MEKLLEVRIGGPGVRSGMLPVRTFHMLQDLLASIAEEGGDPRTWGATNPHVEFLGAGSSVAAVHTEFGQQLRPYVAVFARKARSLNLSAKALDFVTSNITSQTPWSYIEVFPLEDGVTLEPVRFDPAYREKVTERHAIALKGHDEIYAYILRAGGEPPSGPTVQLVFPGGGSKTYPVRDVSLGKKLGDRLYETVKLDVEVDWDPVNLALSSLKVVGLAEDWQDVHLHDVLEKYGGRLPVELTTESVEELLANRAMDRDED